MTMQGDFHAKGRTPSRLCRESRGINASWQSLIQRAVALITQRWELGLAEFMIHGFTDYANAQGS